MTHDQYWQLFQAVQHVLKETKHMTQIATDTAAAVAGLDSKVDALIAAISPGVQALRDALQAAQTQITSLQAGEAADASTLQTTISAAQDEASKVQAVIDALTPTATKPA